MVVIELYSGYDYLILQSSYIHTYICTVDPHLSEHLGTEGWLDMRNVQITETGVNAL